MSGARGSPLRILMLSGTYPPDTLGGAEVQLRLLATALVRRGHTVTVLTSRTRSGTPGAAVEDGVVVSRLRVRHPPQNMGPRVASTVSWTARVLAATRGMDVDVVHSNQAKFPAAVGAWVSRRRGVPHVAKVGDSDRKFDLASLDRKRLVGPALARYVRDNTDAFVAIAEPIAADLAAFGVDGDRIVRVPNGVTDRGPRPQHRPVELRRALGMSGDGTVVVFVGRLAREKNLDRLFEACDRVGASGARLELHIVGDGPLRQSLEARAAGNGPTRVVVHGAVDDPVDFYRAADLLVLPSLAEGMSNALLEAAMTGLPAVATPVGGNPEIVVDGETGYLSTGTDVSALEAALGRALRDGENVWSTMSSAVRRRALRRHAIEEVAASYERLYERLIAGSSAT